MYNTSEAKCLGSARASQNYDQPKAVRIAEIPESLSHCQKEVDELNDELNALHGRLGQILIPQPCTPSDAEKQAVEPHGLLSNISRIRRSIACATSQVRQITSALMV